MLDISEITAYRILRLNKLGQTKPRPPVNIRDMRKKLPKLLKLLAKGVSVVEAASSLDISDVSAHKLIKCSSAKKTSGTT